MSSSEIEQRVSAYYTARIEEHGATARGVDWNSESSQRLRFEQLLKVAPDHGSLSINDYGCGYGALLDHLDVSGRAVRYHGYDISPAMIARAQARHGHRPDATFSDRPNRMPMADVTVASGIFNVIGGVETSEWKEYVRDTILRMARTSEFGVAFNMLTTFSDAGRMIPKLHYADPCEMFGWCKRELSRNVALLHDYDLYEFTIIVRLEPGR